MAQVGTATNPLRVAIIGAGPSGFYVAEHLFNHPELIVEIDLIERLPTPYGLVRGGVAPDHPKIKSVTATYDTIAAHPGFHYYGGVEFGRHLTCDDLRALYHQMVFTTGAQTDQRMGIPGEDLHGSAPATAFVAWYNGHPDFCDMQFDLSHECAAVVGVGNVAVDVARILCSTPEELAATDIADSALEALRHSRITKVYMLGRRGPAQAAFTTPELKELGELAGASLVIRPEEAVLDACSRADLDKHPDRATIRKVEMLQAYARSTDGTKPRQLMLRFLVSPVALMGDSAGRVVGMRLVHNVLSATEVGTLRPKPTDVYEEVPVGLVLRSVGYRGVPLPGVPFDDRWGVILNQKGRVLDPVSVAPAAAEARIRERQPAYVSYADWQRLNALEVARGQAAGRPRVKFTRVEEMYAALREASGP